LQSLPRPIDFRLDPNFVTTLGYDHRSIGRGPFRLRGCSAPDGISARASAGGTARLAAIAVAAPSRAAAGPVATSGFRIALTVC
jgi:hypothetical protein